MTSFRTFIPGSEWLYFKIYTGVKTADSLLKQEICKWINELYDSGIIRKWFFIRYNDPDFHIRLRINLMNENGFNEAFSSFYRIFNNLINSDVIWKVECDTYQREIERYGSNSIHLIEDLFFIDSESILYLIKSLERETKDNLRWSLSLVLIDSFLTSFSRSIDQRNDLLKMMSENFKKEFGIVNQQMRKQLNNKFRVERRTIEAIMSSYKDNDVIYIDIIKNKRDKLIFPIAQKIIQMNLAGELQIPLDMLLINLIHMTMNRWFRSKNRLYELVIYDFLSRYYVSEIARNKS